MSFRENITLRNFLAIQYMENEVNQTVIESQMYLDISLQHPYAKSNNWQRSSVGSRGGYSHCHCKQRYPGRWDQHHHQTDQYCRQLHLYDTYIVTGQKRQKNMLANFQVTASLVKCYCWEELFFEHFIVVWSYDDSMSNNSRFETNKSCKNKSIDTASKNIDDMF